MDVIAVVKEHPIPVVIGVVIVILIISRSGGTVSNGSVNSGSLALQSQQLAVQSNTQIAGINSQTAVSLGAQATERYKAGESAATTRAGIAASLVNTSIGALSQQALDDSANNLKIVQATFARAINNDNLAADSLNKQNAINANVQMNVNDIQGQIIRQNSDNNFKLSQIGAATGGSLTLLNAQGQIQKDLLGMNLSFTGANLPTILQHQENIAAINGNNAVKLATVNTQASVINANAAADASQTKSDQSWVSTIGNIVGSFFG